MQSQKPSIYSNHELAVILFTVSLASFLNPVYTSMVNIAIPAIGNTFVIPTDMLAMLSTTYLISTLIFLIPAARLADIIGLKRVLLTGLGIATIAALVAPFSPTVEVLLLSQIIAGIGFAGVISNAIALLSSIYPPERQGGAIGIAVSAVYLGLIAGPLLGGALVGWSGWGSIYIFSLILCLATWLLVKISVREEIRATPNEPFDLCGSILYGTVILFLMLGLTRLPDPVALLCVCIGGVLLLLFIRLERRTEYPVFAARLFSDNPVFIRANLATMINYGATYAVSFFMSLYLQVTGKLTPMEAGTLMIAMPLVQMAFSPITGKLSDKIGGRILMTVGMTITGIGMGLLGFLGTGYNRVSVVISLAVVGLGVALFAAPNTHLILSSVRPRDNGSANSIIAVMRELGMVISMAVATCFITFSFGDTVALTANMEGLVASMHLTFGLGTLLCFIGAVVAWTAKQKI